MNRLQLRNHRSVPLFILALLAVYASCLSGIVLNPSIEGEDVSISQITVNEVIYDILAIEEYPPSPSIVEFSSPFIPSKLHHFLLPF